MTHLAVVGEHAEQRDVTRQDADVTVKGAGQDHLGLTRPDLLLGRDDRNPHCHALQPTDRGGLSGR